VRYGGDEFVSVLPGCDMKNAQKIVGDIQKTFRDKTSLSFSFGVAELGTDIFRSIKEADSKMYEMKREFQ
jgi:GGDEF domain-containing protein